LISKIRSPRLDVAAKFVDYTISGGGGSRTRVPRSLDKHSPSAVGLSFPFHSPNEDHGFFYLSFPYRPVDIHMVALIYDICEPSLSA
jgi:hypothetical protein